MAKSAGHVLQHYRPRDGDPVGLHVTLTTVAFKLTIVAF